MKRTQLLMDVSAITFAGCQKEGPVSTTIDGTKITELRSYTEKSPNPIAYGSYKLDNSEETLESLRHVSRNRLFYMDYLADFPMEQLWKAGEENRYDYKSDLSGETEYLSDFVGLCYCMLQLPPLQKPKDYNPEGTMPHITLENKKGDYSLPQLVNSSIYYMLLTRCVTVKEVEKALKEDYDYTQLNHIMNGHFLIADTTGDYAVFEYWNDKLYVLRADDRRLALTLTPHVIPFEYNCMENYYCNPEATATYMDDEWQYGFISKQRVGRMMTFYEPVMSEFEALKCLQKGTYEMQGN